MSVYSLISLHFGDNDYHVEPSKLTERLKVPCAVDIRDRHGRLVCGMAWSDLEDMRTFVDALKHAYNEAVRANAPSLVSADVGPQT